MIRLFVFLLLSFILFLQSGAQHFRNFALENTVHAGYIVRNAKELPGNKMPFLLTINPSFQADGQEDWHQEYGFPRAGVRLTLGSLGNCRELGYMVGLTPNMTLRTGRHRYMPELNLGLGLSWFSRHYDAESNPYNYYIGSGLTAMAEASLQIEPKIGNKTYLISGIKVFHCSNSHFQVPNLGLNVISLYMGILLNPEKWNPVTREIIVPKQKIHWNVRSGIGVHELSRTMGPAGTPKYIIYTNDLYLSRLFGKVSNVHLGLEVNYYKSYYNYIVSNNFFGGDQRLKSTVVSVFLAHEFMIKHFSILAQGGVNLYNKFYNNYVNLYKSEKGADLMLKKLFPARLGIQYYLFDPEHCTRRNIFLGAYVKTNFSQADFACFQAGVVL